MLLKKKGVWLASVLVLNSWVGGALAEDQQSAKLKVTASIIPGSCSIEFPDGNNTVDFGSVSSGKISLEDHSFVKKNKVIKIKCTAKMKAKISANDDKNTNNVNVPNDNFILTDNTGEKRGHFSIKINEYVNVPNVLLYSKTGIDDSWETTAEAFYLNPKNSNGDKKYISIGTKLNNSLIIPSEFEEAVIPLEISGGLYKFDNAISSVTEILKINGEANFTIEYM